MRACVHSVGMLCGYMPNSSYYYFIIREGPYIRWTLDCGILLVINIILFYTVSAERQYFENIFDKFKWIFVLFLYESS